MLNKYNQRLHDIAAGSPLTMVGMMLYICDENLIVCMRSAGALRTTAHLIIGSDVKKSLDPSFVKELAESSEARYSLLYVHGEMIGAIFVPGELDGMRFFTVLCDVERLPIGGFVSGTRVVGLDLIGRLIGKEVGRLLACKECGLCKLNCTLKSLIVGKRFIDLFTGDEKRRRTDLSYDRVSIYRTACIIKSELEKCLPRHRLEIDYHGLEAYSDNASFKALSSFIGTAVFNLLAVSEDRVVHIEIDSPFGNHVKVHFSTAICADIFDGFTCTENTDLDVMRMLELYSPFAFEYAVCREFASGSGWDIGFCLDVGKVDLTVVFSVHEVQYIPYVRDHDPSWTLGMVAAFADRLGICDSER